MLSENHATLHKRGEGQPVEGQDCCTRSGPGRAANLNWSLGATPLIENKDLHTKPVIRKSVVCVQVGVV